MKRLSDVFEDEVGRLAEEEAAKNDYNLSPSRYVAGAEQEKVLPLEEAIVLLQEADLNLKDVLARLG